MKLGRPDCEVTKLDRSGVVRLSKSLDFLGAAWDSTFVCGLYCFLALGAAVGVLLRIVNQDRRLLLGGDR